MARMSKEQAEAELARDPMRMSTEACAALADAHGIEQARRMRTDAVTRAAMANPDQYRVTAAPARVTSDQSAVPAPRPVPGREKAPEREFQPGTSMQDLMGHELATRPLSISAGVRSWMDATYGAEQARQMRLRAVRESRADETPVHVDVSDPDVRAATIEGKK